jgi:hypothetical protein
MASQIGISAGRSEPDEILDAPLPMTIAAKPNDDPAQTRDADELRSTLFRTLSDLRAGRITAQEAKAVTTTVTKALFWPSKNVCGAIERHA